ncbi:MAG: VWA domain-containing protein [Candidatus Acidiferrales bacterium]
MILTCSKSRQRLASFTRLGAWLGAFLALPMAAQAQGVPAPIPTSQEPLKVQSQLHVVEASVADSHGDFRNDLKASQFLILDNGVEQKITFFEPVESPAHIAVLIETSPAVYLIQGQHLSAAYALLDGLATTDEVALVTYDEKTRLVLPFTADKRALLEALDGLQYFLGMGDLNFYDAVRSTLAWLPAANGKKALLVLATGLDSSPPAHWQALQHELQMTDVPVFTVALGGSVRDHKGKKPEGKNKPQDKKNAGTGSQDETANAERKTEVEAAEASFERADAALREIAETTGGRSYFPASLNEFAKVYREIAAQLRHQYLLAYTPPAPDGRIHTIEIRVVDAQRRVLGAIGVAHGMRVYARQSYLAPEK